MIPKVSIIIPNYNHATYLQQRLDSVFNQTFQDFEVIILDDASTDNSLEILNNYKNHSKVSHFVVNEINSGSPFKQWQKGISQAKGEFVWIAESDDYCENIFLEKLINKFDESVELIYCQSIDVDEQGEFVSNRLNYTKEFKPNIWESNFQLKGERFIEEYLSIKNVIPNASAVVFKRCFVDNDIFDLPLQKMKMLGDWILWIRIINSSSVGFVSEALNYFRSHEAISRSHNTIERRKRRLLEEIWLRNDWILENIESSLDKRNELINKWFGIHAKFDVFSESFYGPCVSITERSSFICAFINFKIKH